MGPLLCILYTSNITNIAHRHGITIHLYADDTQLYIKLSTNDIINAKSILMNCIREIQNWSASMRLKLNASKTELIWFDRKLSCDNDSPSKIMEFEASNFTVPSQVVRNLGVLLDHKLTMVNRKSCFLSYQSLLLPSSPYPPGETMPQRALSPSPCPSPCTITVRLL